MRLQTRYSCLWIFNSVNEGQTGRSDVTDPNLLPKFLNLKGHLTWIIYFSPLPPIWEWGVMTACFWWSHGLCHPADQNEDYFKSLLLLNSRAAINGCRCSVRFFSLCYLSQQVSLFVSPFAIAMTTPQKPLWSRCCQTSMQRLQQWDVPVSQLEGSR